MCNKFIVFYMVVFSVKTVLSGVNINNGSNFKNTHQMYLNNQNNVKNGHNTNKPLDLLNISRNINHHVQILAQYDQNIKGPSQIPSLLPFRQPLNEPRGQFSNEHVSLPSKRVEKFHNSGNQYTRTLLSKDILKHEDNRPNNHPKNFKVIPFMPEVEDKNVVRTKTGLVKNENMKTLIPSTLQPAPSAPNVRRQLSNTLTPHINEGQRSVMNNAFNHKKSAASQQTILHHEGHIQPQRTVQKPRKKIQTNHSPQSRRFTVIHDNGSIEYFEDLETILREYPHIRIADNIRKLIPNQKPKIPLATARNSDPNANIKINRPLNILKSTLKQKIESNSQPKIIPLMNKSNYNFGSLYTTTKIPVTVDSQKSEKLQTATKEPIKLKNSIPITPTNSQENKVKNQENTLTTKSIDIYDMNNKTTLNNQTTIDSNRQKPPIDLILNSDQTLHQENKANMSRVISNHENSHKVTSKLEKDDNLHLNDSKEVKSSIVLQNKTNIKTDNITSENKQEIVNNNSSLNYDKVESETQPNCTKTNEFKNQLITNSNVKILKDTQETDEDYDEDLLSLAKPLMWFSTTDPDFWKKLVSGDDNPNFLYIINVQSRPKIEKDRKTTIHANGTIVEEITETIWNAGDERPKITKTIKVTPANAINEGI